MPENKHTNRLIREKSPYLLQHAHNPVDWYPWGDEAFGKAEEEDKPVFLSIGYSTCHWCHVMERECFEDEEVARELNRSFVSVKVDREERPDVDGYFMEVCQLLTGSGGWPLSIFMDSRKQPFFAGTYFPKEDQPGLPGFLSVLRSVSRLWRSGRRDLAERTRKIMDAVPVPDRKSGRLGPDLPDRVFRELENNFDEEYGGFFGAPKFPSPQNLLFLLRYRAATGDGRALELCEKTLNCMREGGIFDQIGFGFSRYSTDGRWLVPHFEKMLDDNALLCMVYTECFQATGDPFYRTTASEIIEYLTGRMTSPEGAFYSAEDADSEGEEGKFYRFGRTEVEEVLGDRAREFCRYYHIDSENSVPNRVGSGPPGGRLEFLEGCRRDLLRYREKRTPPPLDDKILASRNGLAVAALSLAGRAFGEPGCLKAAKRAADFVLGRMTAPDGRLYARFRDGEARFPGYAGDYAFLIWGLIELYESVFDPEYLRRALKLNEVFLDRFLDREIGGFFESDAEAEQMPVRAKTIRDGAAPSANAVEAYNLIRLSRIGGREDLEREALRTLEAFAPELERFPLASPFAAAALLYLRDGGTDVVLAGDEAGCAELLGAVRKGYRPFLTAVPSPGGEGSGYPAAEGKPAAYVCRNHVCSRPVSTPEELERLLGGTFPKARAKL